MWQFKCQREKTRVFLRPNGTQPSNHSTLAKDSFLLAVGRPTRLYEMLVTF